MEEVRLLEVNESTKNNGWRYLNLKLDYSGCILKSVSKLLALWIPLVMLI